ncbi:Rossmann-like and DUF2520 domain-containing protein [Roseburia sp. 499]|uniref:Rossmann-like and DUF2520 domain-containing protein n=1 Tax=Roseburia sp. 499 TaxID=1261634 RepID=UPI0009F9109D|nr:Rossmann-like and DUF2520 domain-containing protein [Roseburia sp. 499]WVK68904.1 Rossmann-like and DUF2520 domain-containing protein [Roseburia sp. 499]
MKWRRIHIEIGIIGAGRVGTTMGKYIMVHGGNVQGFYSRTPDSAREAAQFCNTNYFKDLDSLIEVSDTLFITTNDGAIKEIWDCIAKKNVKGKVICHFSGSLSSDIFSNKESSGAIVCSVHPIYAFSNKFTAYQNLTEALFTVEGDAEALKRMQEVFALLPNRIVEIPTNAKAKYHAAASIASNQVTGLLWMAIELLKESGITEEIAYDMLEPLVKNSIDTIFFNGCKEALTGPIERGDLGTVEKHLKALEKPLWNQAYRAAGSLVTELAKEKNPDKDYGEIEQLLRESK